MTGKSSITAGKIARAGGSLRISGRLYGGYIPTDGVLVQMWFRVKGIPSPFGPFDKSIHTNSNGNWSLAFPVPTQARGFTYLFEAVIQTQTDWPFLATTSAAIARHVS